MNDLMRMNQYSWELATLAILKKGRDVEAYSTDQIRRVMSAGSSDDLTDIRKIINNYSPASPQGKKKWQAQKEIGAKHEANKAFGDRLLEIIAGSDVVDVSRFLQYTLWNIKIIEKNNVDVLSRELDCEGVTDKEVLNQLKQILEADKGPRKNYERDNRRK